MKTIISLITFIAFTATAWAYNENHMQKNIMPLRQPEILADTTQRIERGNTIPVLLIIRHADLFPITLDTITVSVMFQGGKHELEKHDYYDKPITDNLWYEMREIAMPDGFTGGRVTIDVKFDIEMNGKKKTIRNDNTPRSAHRPLELNISRTPLPAEKNWYIGDIHFHTAYSENQVEFGAPLDASARMADAYGYNWLAITDHSFDLDDIDNDTTTNDPDLKKWQRYKDEIKHLTRIQPDVVFISGEENSCGNSLNQNVHLLVLNNENFLPGNGDGYEGPNTPTQPCKYFLDNLPPNAAAYAAHPFEEPNPVSLYIINRGQYTDAELTHPNLSGMEFWNNSPEPQEAGYKKWISMLLNGSHAFIAAGSDAHGDFQSAFGIARTAVFVPDKPTPDTVTAALRKGNSIATSGPFISIKITNKKNQNAIPGESISGKTFTLHLSAISSPEFGPLKNLTVFAGNLDTKNEMPILNLAENQFQSPYKHDLTLQIQNLKHFYIRAEAQSSLNDKTFYVLTNPIWGKIE